MKKITFLLGVSLLLFLNSCGAIGGLFGSGEADIKGFTFDGIVGEAVIDTENRTIDITTEPMDVSTIDPTITVSEGATVTEPAEIKDGEAVVYKVTAENGDIIDWNVTITAQIGIKLTIDDTTYIYTDGFSTDCFDKSDINSPDLSELGSAKVMYINEEDGNEYEYYIAYAISREINSNGYEDGDKIIRITYGNALDNYLDLTNSVMLEFVESEESNFISLIDEELLTYSFISSSNVGEGNSRISFSGTCEDYVGNSVSITCFVNAPVTNYYDFF